jgi:CHAD domain-containing protein
MAYRLDLNEPVSRAVQQCVVGELKRGLAEIADGDCPRDETVHQLRKRMKKIRGAARLVRPELGKSYRKINAYYRDLASSLGSARDAAVRVETLERLRQRFPGALEDAAVHKLHELFASRRRQLEQNGHTDLNGRLHETEAKLAKGLEQLARWRTKQRGFSAVEPGLRETYVRGRAAFKKTLTEPTAENFHEWRKHVKYHWYHTRLLAGIRPRFMRARRNELRRLAELLGDDHDVSVLEEALPAAATDDGDEHLATLRQLIARRRQELREQAHDAGGRLYTDTGKQLVKRWRRFWNAARAS